MNDYGLVSIIMPVFNAQKYVNEAINSVISQTYKNWELIITDDCSTDNTQMIVDKYVSQYSNINYYRLSKNQGPAIARNNSLMKANGKYIAFLDSDDVWMSHKLDTQLRYMKENKIAFSYSNYSLINEQGMLLNRTITVPKSITYNQYLRNTIIGCLTVIIDKEQVGDFRIPEIRTSEDMALWLLIMKRGYIAYGIKESLANYRIVSNSFSAHKIKAAQDVWVVYRDIEKLSLFISVVNFLFYVYNAIKKRVL